MWVNDAASGLLVRKRDAQLREVAYTYDAAGRLLTRTWSRSVGGQPLVTTYGYDPVTRDISSVTYSDGTTPAVGMTYDRLGRQVSATTAATAQTVFTYRTDNLLPETETEWLDADGNGTMECERVFQRGHDALLRPAGFSFKPAVESVETDASATYGYEPVAGRVGSVSGLAGGPVRGVQGPPLFKGLPRTHRQPQIIPSMSNLGQLLMTGVPGPVLDAQTAAAFRRIQPGAFILFGRNIQTPSQLRKLCEDLCDLSEVKPIITIDQEGGRVSRLKLIGNEPPNANNLRDKGDPALIRSHGRITGRLLRMFGFNLDLCPVLDISFDDEADNSLRGRCYGNNAAEVIRNAGAFNEALRAEGIATCGKHFPGYSRCPADAHHELPSVSLPRAELDPHELAVFRHFCTGANAVDSMMIGHAFYPALDDSGVPTSLSRRIISDLLRGEFGFRGLVMTDDLDMGAILNPYGTGDSGLEKVIELAITAGNDIAMICHRVEMAEKAHGFLGRLPRAEVDRALANVAAFKTRLVKPDPWDEAEFRRRDAEVWDLRVATLGAERAAQRSTEDGKRSPVEVY